MSIVTVLAEMQEKFNREDMAVVLRQRDELLAALKRVGCQDDGMCGTAEWPAAPDGRCFVCAAIANAEGRS